MINLRTITIFDEQHLKLFKINLKNLNKEEVNDAFSLLDKYEKEKTLQYKNIDSKNTFSICRAYTKKLLSEFIEKEAEKLSFDYTKDGKPYLNGNPINFNISHSHDFGLIGISNRPVGVDIEKIDETRNWNCIAEFMFSKKEIEWLKQHPSSENFYLLWTLKEARLKCDGFSSDSAIFKEVSFDLNSRPVFYKYNSFSFVCDLYQISAVILDYKLRSGDNTFS